MKMIMPTPKPRESALAWSGTRRPSRNVLVTSVRLLKWLLEEDELERANERADLAENKLKGVEEELESVGQTTKSLETSAEKAVEKEEKLKDKIHTIQLKFKGAEGRFEYGEMNITQLNQRPQLNQKIKKVFDELGDTFDDMPASEGLGIQPDDSLSLKIPGLVGLDQTYWQWEGTSYLKDNWKREAKWETDTRSWIARPAGYTPVYWQGSGGTLAHTHSRVRDGGWGRADRQVGEEAFFLFNMTFFCYFISHFLANTILSHFLSFFVWLP